VSANRKSNTNISNEHVVYNTCAYILTENFILIDSLLTDLFLPQLFQYINDISALNCIHQSIK